MQRAEESHNNGTCNKTPRQHTQCVGNSVNITHYSICTHFSYTETRLLACNTRPLFRVPEGTRVSAPVSHIYTLQANNTPNALFQRATAMILWSGVHGFGRKSPVPL